MKFKNKIIEEFGQYIYQDKDGNYAIDSDPETHRPCYVYLKDNLITCKCLNMVKERSFKECYNVLKQGLYQKISI